MRISVVVPVRDDARIADLLASLANQRGAPEFEVLVALDGGARRGTVPAVLDERVRVLDLPARGPYAARNAAAREARGEILVFTDSDCVCPPDWMARAAREFDDPGVSALQGGSEAYRDSRLSRWIQLEYERYVRSHEAAGYRRLCNTRNFAIRRRVFERLPFPEDRQRGGDGSYGWLLDTNGIGIRYEPRWIVLHQHPEDRRTFARQVFRQGLDGARWKRSGGIDLFGTSDPRRPGARLLRLASRSPRLEEAASAALIGVSAVLGAATLALPFRAGRPVFDRFTRAAHLAGRLRGEAEAAR